MECEHTVFFRLHAATFITFLAFPMRRLFEAGVYLEITDNSYCKSFAKIR